jgi:nitrate/TMAO reductase-like tetraheme cytochrome c subunit
LLFDVAVTVIPWSIPEAPIQLLHRLSEKNILAVVALVCAIGAAGILVTYLVRRSPLDARTRYWLLFGLGVLPIGSAMSANVQGYETTKRRQFCASCHVMTPHARDAEDTNSKSLAAIHARSPYFGEDNCYACHADYGLFGTVVTKMGGLRHVWLYATDYRNASLEEAKQRIHLLKPYPNGNCMQCHTTTAPVWSKLPDHQSAKADVLAGKVSCASAGCHGVVHPLTKASAP